LKGVPVVRGVGGWVGEGEMRGRIDEGEMTDRNICPQMRQTREI
jgi:hypothetical protein